MDNFISSIKVFNKLIEKSQLHEAHNLGSELLNRKNYPKSLKKYIKDSLKSFSKNSIPIKNLKKTKKIKEIFFKARIEVFDEVNNILSGWIFSDFTNSGIAHGILKVNNIPFQVINTSANRRDVSKHFSKEGNWGFKIQFDPMIFGNIDLELIIEFPISEFQYNSQDKFIIKKSEKIQEVDNLIGRSNSDFLNFKEIPHNKIIDQSDNGASFIMLNLNGGEVLVNSINSIINELRSFDELIIIDHGSNDKEISTLKSFSDPRLKIIERGKNYSFSESNNFAVRQSKNDILIFINNDIIINDGSLIPLISPLLTKENCIVGGILLDIPRDLTFLNYKESLPNCIQHCGINVSSEGEQIINAKDFRIPIDLDSLETGKYLEVSTLTGALLAIKKNNFYRLEGFNERFFYGQEDVHLCLKNKLVFGSENLVSLEAKAFHFHGYTRLNRKNNNSIKFTTLKRNRTILDELLGQQFKKYLKRNDVVNNANIFELKSFNVGFIVSDISLDTSAGDVFTAFELANSLQEFKGIKCYLIKSMESIDASKFDLIINMLCKPIDKYLLNSRTDTYLVAWMRNWFDKWCDLEDIDIYDVIYTTSTFSKDFVSNNLNKKVNILKIAASKKALENKTFRKNKKLSYGFIGSFFNSPRRLANWLDPNKINHNFILHGFGWEKHRVFKNYTLGPLSYEDVFDKYQKLELLLDDANIATDKWGSVNCRVFDALAMGVKVITNGYKGSLDTFNGELPVFSDSKNLIELINNTLNGEHNKKFEKLFLQVRENHTYEKRAIKIIEDLNLLNNKRHIRINTAIPKTSVAREWGDLYLARAIRKKLEENNRRVSISFGENKNRRLGFNEDINFNLRGLEPLNVPKFTKSIIWVISHPDKINFWELHNNQMIFVASEKFAINLNNIVKELDNSPKKIDKVKFVPQFTTLNKFNDLENTSKNEKVIYDFIFIGNTRNVFRDSVKLAIKNNLNVRVIGKGWENFVPKELILDQLVPNKELPNFYNLGRVVLCDHWEDMKNNGFISNRIYDLIFLNKVILCDSVLGIKKIKKRYNNIFVYENEKDFMFKANQSLKKAKKQKIKQIPQNNNHFCYEGLDSIVNEIIKIP